MSTWKIDLAISGPGWLERSGTLRAAVKVVDEDAPFVGPTGSPTLTYTLLDSTGATAASGTANVADGWMITAIALGSALDADETYLEHWTGTIGDDTIDQYREARVSRHAASRRTYPTTTLAVIGSQPMLWTYPAGLSNWQIPIGEAWSTISYRLWATGPAGDVWTPGQLSTPTLYLARALIYQQGSTTPGDAFGEQAAFWRREYERWWEGGRLVVDADVSGTPDTPGVGVGGMAPSVPGPGRR